MEKDMLEPSFGREVLRDVLKTLEKDEYIQIAKAISVEIKGFSTKKLATAPAKMLEKNVRQSLLKLKSAHVFLQAYIHEAEERFEAENAMEMIVRMQMDEQLSNSYKLALLGVHFPSFYKEKRERILQNIEEGRDPLNSLSNHEQSFSSILGVAAETVQPTFMEELAYTAARVPGQENRASLRKQLKESMPTPLKGFYLKGLYSHMDEWIEWSMDEQAGILRLALQDAVHIAADSIESGSRLEDAHIQYREAEETKYKSLQIRLADEIQKNRLAAEMIENQKKQMNKMRAEYELEIERQRMEKTEQEKQMQIADTLTERAPDPIVLEKEDIILASKVHEPIFQQFLSHERVLLFSSIDDLEELLADEGRELFINSDGLTTKEMFRIENMLEESGKRFRYVGQGPVHVLRQIIYYLEGELRYEAIEQNQSGN